MRKPCYYVGGGFYLQPLLHGLTIAGSGHGKGVCIILPNLLSPPLNSWFVLDPKGEIAIITAKWQSQQGQKVVILDPGNE
ncbi:type IV secretory system conjugative DNA transfer family protein [Runella slithyformis]|uniref:type IV secretory system conjugative DNA transfer family protein n=1 Tax=Runella slithyformis TaxID=106 RepID=UPI0035B57D95